MFVPTYLPRYILTEVEHRKTLPIQAYFLLRGSPRSSYLIFSLRYMVAKPLFTLLYCPCIVLFVFRIGRYREVVSCFLFPCIVMSVCVVFPSRSGHMGRNRWTSLPFHLLCGLHPMRKVPPQIHQSDCLCWSLAMETDTQGSNLRTARDGPIYTTVRNAVRSTTFVSGPFLWLNVYNITVYTT